MSSRIASGDLVVVLAAAAFALVVQSGFFTSSNWMLGDLAYHRGVAYTMQAGDIQGEGPYRGLITYYGGLYPLLLGGAAQVFGTTFDQVLSVLSWLAGPIWVAAAWILGRRLWPDDRLIRLAFVVLATVAVPLSQDPSVLWVNSILASSQAYWPLYPRDVALILLVGLGATSISVSARTRVLGSGVLIGLIVLFHLQLALLGGWLVVVHSGWMAARARDLRRILEVPAVGLVALLLSAWWWVPRVAPTLAGGTLLLSDYPTDAPLRLDPLSYLLGMGLVGVLSLVGFGLFLASRYRTRAATLIVTWAFALLVLVPLSRMLQGLDLISERRIWLVFSIPAIAAAAVAAAAILRSRARPLIAGAVALAVIASVPGTFRTVDRVEGVWPTGSLGYETVDPATWEPIWASLRTRSIEERGLVLGTYDAYGLWAWSFSGAQPVSLWLPGWLKLGFDPQVVTGLGYLARRDLLASAFEGQTAMCDRLSEAGASVFLLDRLHGLIATYDRTPAMDFRVEPQARSLESIDRVVGPGLQYVDSNLFDELDMSAGATYHLDWFDQSVRLLVIEADLGPSSTPPLIAQTGATISPVSSSGQGRHTYAIDLPQGLGNGLTLRAGGSLRLYRISAFAPVPGTVGPDGPFLVNEANVCT